MEETDPLGTVSSYGYDDLNRMTSRSVVPAEDVTAPMSAETYQYDALSNLVHAENDHAIVNRTFDSFGGILNETTTFKGSGEVFQSSAEFDGIGNMTSLTYPGGRRVDYTYSGLNQIETITSGGSLLATNHRVGSRLERRDLGNGTRYRRGYDVLSRTTSTEHSRWTEGDPGDWSLDEVLDSRLYQWDLLNNKTSRATTHAGGVSRLVHYTYDRLSQMTDSVVGLGALEHVYALDVVGNRETVSVDDGPGLLVYGYDSLGSDVLVHRYSATPFEQMRDHDANGNLASVDTGGFLSATTTTMTGISWLKCRRVCRMRCRPHHRQGRFCSMTSRQD